MGEKKDTAKVPSPPRENIYRSLGKSELRSDGDNDAPVMTGHFAVFDQWTEINSVFEGNFMERFAPGAFKKTITENRSGMRVLFQHGYDYVVGDKPLGPIRELEEDDEGVRYEVPLLDAGYVRDHVLPGLEEDLYGASFRFRVIREDFNREPGESDHNPEGLPERTVREAHVPEFGPVTFPAYEGASAGIRSLSDEFVVARLTRDPEKLRSLMDVFIPETKPVAEKDEQPESRSTESEKDDSAPSEDSAEQKAHPDRERRDSTGLIGVSPRQSTPSWRL